MFGRRKDRRVLEPALTIPGLDAIQRDLVRQYNANEISYAQFKEALAHVKVARAEIERAEQASGRPGAMVVLPRDRTATPLVNNPYLYPSDSRYFRPDHDERNGDSDTAES